MDDPSWREHGPWAFAVGVTWMLREMIGWASKSKPKVTPEDVLTEVRQVSSTVSSIASDLHHIRVAVDRHAASIESHTGRISHIEGRIDQHLKRGDA